MRERWPAGRRDQCSGRKRMKGGRQIDSEGYEYLFVSLIVFLSS